MAKAPPRALYIGPPQVGKALEELRPEWDFQPTVPNIAALWEGLVEGSISNDIQIILVIDLFFDQTGQDKAFEKLVAQMGPYCFLGIINYKENLREHMREQISNEAYSIGADSADVHYYFIDPQKPNPSLDEALNKYVSESNNDEVISIITGRTTSEEKKIRDEQKALEAENNPEKEYAEKYSNEEPSKYLGQVVAVTSSKGGSGKSTVAVSLASYLSHASHNSVREGLADRPLKVIILDLDVRDGQLGFLTGNTRPTVINLRLNGISKETIEETVIHSSRLKCDLLLAPKRPRHSDDTPPEFYVELIHLLRRMYDYIILDTSVNYLDPLLEKVAYPTADQIIFVTDIVVNSIFGMTRWIQEVTKPKDQNGMGINANKIGIVVNKSLSNVAMPGERIAGAALGIPVITIIPSNPKIVAHAVNMQSMEVLLRHKDLYPAIRRLAKASVGNKYKLSDDVS